MFSRHKNIILFNIKCWRCCFSVWLHVLYQGCVSFFVHVSLGEKPFKCQQCGRMFVSSGVLKSHLKTHSGQKDYRCQICQASFTTNGSLTRHVMIHSSIRPFKCPYCNDTFRTIFHCKRHIKNHKEADGRY